MRISLLLIFFVPAFGAFAQVVPKTHYLDRYAHPQKSPTSVQLKVGLTGLQTSNCSLLQPVDQNLFLKPNLSLGLGYQITHYVGLLLRGGYYRNSCKAGSSFEGVRNNNYEGVLAIKHYLFPMRDFDEYRRRYNFYAMAGAGILYTNPKNASTDEYFSNIHDFDKFTWVAPVGIGAEFRLTNFFLMALEANYHLTGTDYLDGMPSTDPRSSQSKDRFVSLGVNVTFRLPHKEYKYDDFLKFKNKPESGRP